MLIQLIGILLIIGVVIWFVNGIKQLDDSIKKLISAVLVIAAILLALQALTGQGASHGRLLW